MEGQRPRRGAPIAASARCVSFRPSFREAALDGKQAAQAEDEGLIPVPSTINPRPTALRWPFFLWVPACSRGCCAGVCGLRGSAGHPLLGPVLLSPGGSSLLVGRVPVGEVRKRPKFCPYYSCTYARTNRAVGCDHCPSRVNCPGSGDSLAGLCRIYRDTVLFDIVGWRIRASDKALLC